MKKFLCVLTLLFALVCVLAACEKPEDEKVDENPQGLDFCLLPDGTYGVKAGNALLLEKIIIPSTYKGKSVTKILPQAFGELNNLKQITIPNSVTSIGYDAFYGCFSLTSITIPENVVEIGASAFAWCSGLISITIPASVTSIGDGAFQKCSSLKTVNWSDDCQLLYIGTRAFLACEELASFIIPASVTSIGKYAFSDCSSLESITVENGNASYHSVENCLIETTSKTLIKGFNNSTIPGGDSVTSIDDDAFRGCSELKSVTIPSSVVSIGIKAFGECTSLISAIFENTNGWNVANLEIPASDLANPATAAKYLTLPYLYCDDIWICMKEYCFHIE